MIDSKMKTYPVQNIKFTQAFEALAQEEKLFLYYISRASIEGAPIVLFHVSYESPALFIIFQSFFSSFKPFEDTKKLVFLNAINKITDVDYKMFIRYAAKFYSNFGNYSVHGKSKFVPELPQEKFEEILQSSTCFGDIKYIWDCVKEIVYDESLEYRMINLIEKKGKNSFYLGEIKLEDIQEIDLFLKNNKIDLHNTRLMMINPNKFCYLVASVEERIEDLENNNRIIGYYGEFSPFLKRVVENLQNAKKFCYSEIQGQVIDDYIECFRSGNAQKHFESQVKWVKDKKPNIEFNLGWTNNLIDPLQKRCTFEGFVGLRDQEKTKKYDNLSANAVTLLTKLPFPEDFYNNPFKTPDFSALDVINFSSNECPLFVNLPNYEQIRENEGSKNFFFANAHEDFNEENLNYCEKNDIEILEKLGSKAFIIHYALHELLGHAPVKCFKKNENGEFNFDINNLINPLTNSLFDKYYENSETFHSKFGMLSKSFLECRADLLALFLGFFKEIHEIFEYDENHYKEIIYCQWLIFIRKGVLGLEQYNEELKSWGSSSAQGAWIFVSYLLENQIENQKILEINFNEDLKHLEIILDKEMVLCYGHELVTRIIILLQIWMSTGNREEAALFFDKYSQIPEHYLKIKKLLNENFSPGRLQLFDNLELDELTQNVYVKEYPETIEGIIQSFVDRYGTSVNKDLYNQMTKYDTNFL